MNKFITLLLLCLACTLTGCTAIAQNGLDYSTTKLIESSSSSHAYEGQTIEMQVVVQKDSPPDYRRGVGFIFTTDAPKWPVGLFPDVVMFRPMNGNYHFNGVKFDDRPPSEDIHIRAFGNLISDDTVQYLTRSNELHVLVPLTKIVPGPYEVQASLKDNLGQQIHLSEQDVEPE